MGNQHYATATMQAPKYAQPGQRAMELVVNSELKVIADVGLVGFPNVGKSTFPCNQCTPEDCQLLFHYIESESGCCGSSDGRGFVIADIPVSLKVHRWWDLVLSSCVILSVRR